MASAGHPPPVLVRPDGKVEESGLVLRADDDPVAVARRKVVHKGHRAPGAATGGEPPIGARSVGSGRHREDRRDPDAARHEDVRRRRLQLAVMARPACFDRVALA
ncbi:hypothetical protein [Streptomyces spiralis]|uniref:hypothetical protein n=1 Tax=Streptomyces spiralis TaxID=66376 RepID=UPI001676D884